MKTLLLTFLMIVLGLSAATSSLNESREIQTLEEENTPQEVILPINSLNEPGSQEGSIFTDATLSSGSIHTCAILDNGSVSCWGSGQNGQLGYGETPCTSFFNSAHVIVNSCDKNTPSLTSSLGIVRTAVAISAGGSHTCAILDNGSVSCWGEGDKGLLGNGVMIDKNTPTLTSSLGIGRTAVAISAGGSHTCAILDNGSVSCWGSSGALGNGGTSDKNTPTLTSSLGIGRTAVAISAGVSHTCAILDNGSVSCWGDGEYGKLGNGGTSDKNTPTLTSSLGVGRTAVAISAGGRHTCAILDNGSVSCWGYDTWGELGNGGYYGNSDKNTPTLTSSLGTGRTAVAISAGYYHTCAILDNGDVSCWGQGSSGALGNGGYSDKYSPTLTSSLGAGRTAVAISAAGSHTCAILDNGDVSCWGYGYYGQMGTGSIYNSNNIMTPTLTSSLGTGRTAALSERDFDNDGTLNIFESTPPSLVSCNAGQYGFYMCVDAPLGKYVPSSASRYATDADAGYYVNQTGQTNQTACLEGTYNPNNGSTSPTDCVVAGAGHYVDFGSGMGQTNQTACLAGTYNPNNGSTSPTDCVVADAGYYVDSDLGTGQSNQTACLAGTYNPNTGSTASTDCVNADAGHYVPSLGQSNQIAASAGYYVNQTGQTNQTACLEGTYNPNNGSTSPTDCVVAGAGHYVDFGSGMGQTNQTACLAGTYNPNTGSTRSVDCLESIVGYYVPISGQSSQTPCLAGTYQATTGQSSCDDADAGHYVPTTGQSSQTECEIGTYQATTGQSSCDAAAAGTWQNNTGQTNQIACAIGTYQSAIGQTSCNNADAGYYVPTTGQSSQTACLAGTYQVTTGQSSCDDADAGYYVSTTGQSSQIACSKGTFQADTGQIACDDADVGYYVDQPGQSSQTVCATGKSTITTQSTSILQCMPDTDGDGVVDVIDTDDDGDNVLDVNDAFPLDATESVDTDNDGTGDNADTDDDGDGVSDANDAFPLDATESVDTDNDGTGDNEDTDDDDDNVLDVNDAFPLDSTESVDTDNDGIGDSADRDDDGDGTPDSKDKFPLDSTEWKDANGDGLGDNKEPLSSFESAQQAPALPLLGFAVVIGIMIMLYRAQPPLKNEEKSLVEMLEEE